jgi:hypothetical protein
MRENMISDAQARSIAAAWHGGQASPLYSLASCGAIGDVDAVRREIGNDLETVEVGPERRPLLALDVYVREHGQRGPVSGWSALWDDTAATVEQC